MRQFLRLLTVFLAGLLAVACGQQGASVQEPALAKLQKGISTEGDVRIAMGRPETVREHGNGERTLEYPKGPNGVHTWMVEIDNQGKLRDYRQVLTEETFALIRPGMSMDQVRSLLGRPRSSMRFNLKQEEVWDWLYQDALHGRRLFNVHFDFASQVVTRVSRSEDPDLRS